MNLLARNVWIATKILADFLAMTKKCFYTRIHFFTKAVFIVIASGAVVSGCVLSLRALR